MTGMTSWRDTVSQQAQDDVDGRLAPALEFPGSISAKHGKFYPYAVVVDRDGQH